MNNTKLNLIVLMISILLSACGLAPSQGTALPGLASTPAAPQTLTNVDARVPDFDHIIVIILENQDYQEVIGNPSMPVFNQMTDQNVLLTHYYAITHPSLPNYIGMISGDTYGITTDCKDCLIHQTSLPDLLEANGRTWKAYEENIPSPCFLGNSGNYVQKHDPFIYFDLIQKNVKRCKEHIVSLQTIDQDLQANQLPNFVFITPNLCDDAHSCTLATSDQFLSQMIQKLQASPSLGQNYLIFVAFDESRSDSSFCCGLSSKTGGHVAALLISPQAKSAFREDTPLSHYSLLKTILISWKLPMLGVTAKPSIQAITNPWR
jgi:hypothetical protein